MPLSNDEIKELERVVVQQLTDLFEDFEDEYHEIVISHDEYVRFAKRVASAVGALQRQHVAEIDTAKQKIKGIMIYINEKNISLNDLEPEVSSLHEFITLRRHN